jgi:outer membrane protein assembly factor BamA
MHYGRYGAGANDGRLLPLFLGYPTLVRGYDVNSFSIVECVPAFGSECPVVDRLLGNRMLVGNAEFRVPLLRPFGVSRSMYGPVPIETALFLDGGVAWNRGERPALLGGTRHGVASAGITVRANLLGFAVAQMDFARPFQRPGAGWEFQFTLLQGF